MRGIIFYSLASRDLSAAQYGNVFTFILFGRRVTVALGAQGNNFILGGKHAAFSAEDAYTVSIHPRLNNLHFLFLR
jgi:hypothetical protein